MNAYKFFAAPLLVATLALAGCASTYTPPEGAQPANIKDEAAAVTKHLGCKWLQLPDPMYPAKGNDFACVADTFASVILFVEPSKVMASDGVPKVEKIKLIWKEWHESVSLVNSKRDASRFIAYIAQRYFPEKDAERLVEMFFGTSDSYHLSNKLDVRYTYRKQPALNLHRLEITNQDPDLNLYTYPAPHEIPAPELTPTSNPTNGE